MVSTLSLHGLPKIKDGFGYNFEHMQESTVESLNQSISSSFRDDKNWCMTCRSLQLTQTQIVTFDQSVGA